MSILVVIGLKSSSSSNFNVDLNCRILIQLVPMCWPHQCLRLLTIENLNLVVIMKSNTSEEYFVKFMLQKFFTDISSTLNNLYGISIQVARKSICKKRRARWSLFWWFYQNNISSRYCPNYWIQCQHCIQYMLKHQSMTRFKATRRIFGDSPIGKFQDEKIRTTPSGSGNNSPFEGKNRRGILLCGIISTNMENKLTYIELCIMRK